MKNKLDKNFILNYQIKGNKIIVNFDKAELGERKFIIDKTKKNEKIILDKMVEQTKSYDEKKVTKDYLTACTSTILCFILTGVLAVFSTSIAILCSIYYPLTNLFLSSIPMYLITAGIFGVSIKKCFDMKKQEKKLRNILYLKNEEKINDKIAENENILASVPKKLSKVADKSIEKPSFNINTINQLSYDELKQLLEVIERNEELGFEHKPSKQKVLVKDLNK